MIFTKLNKIQWIIENYKAKETVINNHIAEEEDIEDLIARYLADKVHITTIVTNIRFYIYAD